MREQDIQRKIIKWLESEGAYVVKVVSATKAGVPDIICCYKSRFIAIEVKTPKTKNNVSQLQRYNLDKVLLAQGYSLVAWELQQVKDFIRGL